MFDKSNTHNINDGRDCRPVAAVNVFEPRVEELPADAHEHNGPEGQQHQNGRRAGEWPAAAAEDNGV